MSAPMAKASDLSSTDRVQRLYAKNVELENRRRKAAHARIPSDPNAWQQMRENYEAIVLEDNAFSEQHEIEYALWQLHYRRIDELRGHLSAALASAGSTPSQNGKGPTRTGPDRITKIRSQFKTFLSQASGYYHDMMLKIRAKCGLPLGYDQETQILSQDGNISTEMKRGLISCHRCLIYLGDLARYKGLYGEVESKARDFAAASSYYMQASSLWPSNGNPHHQLAILALYSGDELVAIYRYFRSLAVDYPFSTARDNLIIAFEKNRQSYSQLPGNAKASVKIVPTRMTAKRRGKGDTSVQKDSRAEANLVKERASSVPVTFKAFSIRFVRLNGILFSRTSLETFEEVYSFVRGDLLDLLGSGANEEYTFGSDAAECRLVIVRLIAILIFSVHNVNRETENQSYAEILQRSLVLQNVFTAIFEFMGLILERCVQLNDPSTSYLLPGIMVFVEWLACRQDIAGGSEVDEKQASARSLFWNHFVSFLNKLLSSGLPAINEDGDETCFSDMRRYDEGETANRLALFEDVEMRGFLPLLPAQLILDFSMKYPFGSDGGNKEKSARVQRIIAAGKALANVIRVGQQTLYYDSKSKRFALGIEPQMSDDCSLFGSWEIPRENGIGQEIQAESQLNLGPRLCIEREEDDEEIVFKPVLSEKNPDGVASKFTSSQVFGSSVNSSRVVDLESHIGGVVSVPIDGFLLKDTYSTCSRQPTPLANITPPYFQPSASTWLGEQVSANEQLTKLSLSENGFPMKLGLQHHLIPQQSFNLNDTNTYPDTVLPSKFDSIMTLGQVVDSLSTKPSPMMPAVMRKNPVSRPVRHAGPPPGFNSIPTKLVDEFSLSGVTSKNENAPMDDYRWLDGYQFTSSTNQGIGINNDFINQSAGNGYHQPVTQINSSLGMADLNKKNSSLGMVSFPFPGKQMPSFEVQAEKQKGWNDYQFLESLSLHQKQQQQLQKGNQQSFFALPEQYQGQTFLEDGFFE
ncbi:nonsense-mediated mRNA decay factor SMG7-like [Rhododendron vialii]|uniref:nonsense-mediated mRNA decay factor SMG7-like n=1 Tax=Rhododendron vialii TaxID=182163 RepID=UPI00265DCA51|nr:nonsense-mediated mRNA decay factor SMG7-like [Rhododendron vialii]XP_058205655.1 nonsense-mediated mRNA decay factor SMG7-like [Rhododendron vialii]XP_058205656.1 nonsense-mediated mRNA decay factor SMG7-like [Rhododendron vialii]